MFRDIVVDLDSADNIFMTDLFDVVVNRFPGEVKKDKIYVQKEPRNQPENPRSFWRRTSKWCQHQYSKAYGLIEQDVDEKDTVLYSLIGKSIYNPGVWGGSRNMVLKVLDMMIEEFKRIDIGERNGNMIVFNNVLYNKIGERHIVSGYPLHSKFKYYEADSDACFIHK